MKNIIVTFFKDVSDIGKTKKFWVGMVSAVGTYLVATLGDTQAGVILMGVLGAFGVYAVPNRKK